MPLKLGKTAPRYDKRTLLYSDYRDTSKLIKVPASFGHFNTVDPDGWGMLGNDSYGDCVFAGAAHETIMWGAEANKDVRFTDELVLQAYSTVTGFDPSDPSTDQGTNVLDALNFRRNQGLTDADGNVHKLCAFISLEPGNYDHLLEAVYLFGAVGIGIQFPASAMDQFNANRPWSPVAGSPIEGGHYIPVVGRKADNLLVVTWGKVQQMTKKFYQAYCDEAYPLLSIDPLTEGKSIEGFDLATLQSDLSKL